MKLLKYVTRKILLLTILVCALLLLPFVKLFELFEDCINETKSPDRYAGND